MNLSSADKLNLFATWKIKILKVLFYYRLCLVQKFPSNPYQFAFKLLPTFWGYIIDTEIYTVQLAILHINIISLSPYILYLFTLYSSVFRAYFIIVFLLRILYVLKTFSTHCCYLQCRYRSSRPGKSVWDICYSVVSAMKEKYKIDGHCWSTLGGLLLAECWVQHGPNRTNKLITW